MWRAGKLSELVTYDVQFNLASRREETIRMKVLLKIRKIEFEDIHVGWRAAKFVTATQNRKNQKRRRIQVRSAKNRTNLFCC